MVSRARTKGQGDAGTKEFPQPAWLRGSASSLYPFESHWLNVGGARMHYLDEGAGRPIVCVHGNPTWSFFYRALVSEFRSSHRVIVPDHVGCGLSDKPGDRAYEYTLDRRVADLEALLDHLGLQANVTLVVHDWGGMIGLAAAVRRPARIARLVILNTAGFMKPAGKRLPWQLAFVRRVPLLPTLLIRGLNMFARGTASIACVRRLPAEVRAAYLAPYDSWQHRIATQRFVQDIPLSPRDRSFATARHTDKNLHKLGRHPTLICWGRHDPVFDDDFLAEWRRRFPQADVRVFDDAGHYLLEDAGPEVLAAVRSFLRETACRSDPAGAASVGAGQDAPAGPQRATAPGSPVRTEGAC